MIRIKYSCYIMLYSINLISDFLIKSSKNLLIESVLLIHFLFLKGDSIGAYNKILKIYGKDSTYKRCKLYKYLN